MKETPFATFLTLLFVSTLYLPTSQTQDYITKLGLLVWMDRRSQVGQMVHSPQSIFGMQRPAGICDRSGIRQRQEQMGIWPRFRA